MISIYLSACGGIIHSLRKNLVFSLFCLYRETHNISESRTFCATTSLILCKEKTKYLLKLLLYLRSKLFNKFRFSLATLPSMNFEFKAITFLKWHLNIGNFVNFAMCLNHFLIKLHYFGLGCWIMSLCDIFVSDSPEWILSARCSSLISLNEFLLRVVALGLHWMSSLNLILISDYTEWFTCAWYCSQIVNEWAWNFSQIVNEIVEPDIVLRL
jgi:hypothetical protein